MKQKTSVITIDAKDKKEAQEQKAKMCFNPSINAALILANTKADFDPDFATLVSECNAQLNKVAKGDTATIEKMLMAQAYTLDSVYSKMLNKSLSSEYLNQLQIYSKIALKAQSQCRQTLAALAEIKNPKRTTFIKNQAANQQVNFNENSEKNNQNSSNELLTGNNYETLDARGATTPIRDNKELATVGA